MNEQRQAPKKTPPIVAIKQYVENRGENLARALRGTGIDPERFMTLAFNQTLQTPVLLECSPASWFDALQKSATHGLLPDGIHGALVPYKGRVTFQPMYQGLIQRAYASGAVTKVWADVVYQGERFKAIFGSEPVLRHEPSPERGDESKLIACYACANVNGERHFIVLYPNEVAKHRAASKTAHKPDSPWNTRTAEMWKKTAIIVLSKTLPHFAPQAQKFADLVNDAERADLGLDAIEVEAVPVEAPTVEDLKAAVAAEPALEPAPPAEPDGKCQHLGIAKLVREGKLKTDEPPPPCGTCGATPTEGELKAMASKGGKP